MALLGVVAILLFGKRLPEVARSLGSSYREFRKGLSEIQANFEIDDNEYSSPNSRIEEYNYDYDDQDEPVGNAFEPPTDDELVDEDASAEGTT